MMKQLSTLTFTFALLLSSFVTTAQDKQIVMTVEDEQVTLSDFEAIFKKNNRDSVITVASLDEYMELFINFKLKVREAVEMELDKNPSFERELAGYRKQLARPYLIDKELLEDLIQEAYDRKTQEVRASHILVKCEPSAQPADTLKAYNKIMDLRKRILAGEDFETVAKSKAGSEDPSVRENGGDLGYFSAFQMVYPFESAAFETPVGEISMPIRTRYGYHILKIHDKRNARGEIRAAHIMIRAMDNQDQRMKEEARVKAQEIYELIQGGADFAEMAMKFSEDASTARNGGELPWFGTGKMVEEFENAAFALENDGDISEPIQSSYGWHIIKRLEYKPVATFDALESELRKKVSRDSRAEKTKTSFLAKLRVAYGTYPMTKSLKPIYKAAEDDSAFVNDKGIQVKKLKKLQKELFRIDSKSYSAEDFYNYLNTAKIRKRDLTGAQIVDAELEKYIDQELLAYEDSQLEKKHNDFRLLMNEYHDGILLFELTDQKVWSKAVQDTTGLEAFYEANKGQFMWRERMTASIYTCADEKIMKQLKRMIQRGKSDEEIKTKLNANSALNVKVEKDTWEAGENAILETIDWKGKEIQNTTANGQPVVVVVEEVIPPVAKEIDEARGLITAEYQNYLEKEWIKSLREKYRYTVNKEVLHSIAE